MIRAAMDCAQPVAALPGSATSATRTMRGSRVANRPCASQTPLRDRRRRTRATQRKAAWSTATSQGEADRLSLSLRLQPVLKALRHCCKGTVRLSQRRDTRGPQRIEFPTPPAPLRSGIAYPRFQQALALEPIERGVDGIDRYIPPRAGVNLLSDGGAVRGVVELET